MLISKTPHKHIDSHSNAVRERKDEKKTTKFCQWHQKEEEKKEMRIECKNHTHKFAIIVQHITNHFDYFPHLSDQKCMFPP